MSNAKSKRRDRREKEKRARNHEEYEKAKKENRFDVRKELMEKLRFDPRSSQDTRFDLVLETQNSEIPHKVLIQQEALLSLILSPISFAVARGWQQRASPDYVMFAAIYHQNILSSFAMNTVSPIVKVPRWLAYILQALPRKTIKARSGDVGYTFEVVGSPTTSLVDMGPLVYGFMYNLGVVNNTTVVNGMPIVVPPTTPYTPELGAEAAASLWQFLKETADAHEMHEMVDPNAPNKMTRDASAFACVKSQLGGGRLDTGGWMKTVDSETPPLAPLFSVLVERQASVVFSERAPMFLRNFSMDGVFTGGMLATQLHANQIKMKTPPVTSFVDFMEFADVLARAMQKALQRKVEEDEFLTNQSNDATFFSNEIQCPLTLQEMMLILRAGLMSVYSESQPLVQSAYPRTPTSASDNEFVPYLCSVGTGPTAVGPGMLVPRPFKENACSLTMRSLENVSRSGDGNPSYFLPCLGQYALDQLSWKDYQVRSYAEGTTTPVIYQVFKDPSGVTPPLPPKQKGDKRIPALEEVGAEEPLSMVDGKGTSDYVAINDPNVIRELTALWNNWVQTVSDYIVKPTPLVSDPGAGVFYSGVMTNHWFEFTPPPPEERKNIKVKGSIKFKKIGSTDFTIYKDRVVKAVSAGYQPFKAPWDFFQQYMILPINRLSPVTTDLDASTLERVAAFCMQPHIIATSTNITYESLSQLHDLLADLCVRPKYQQKTPLEIIFDKLDENGEAGIIASIGAALVGHFAPGAAPIANAIAAQLPF